MKEKILIAILIIVLVVALALVFVPTNWQECLNCNPAGTPYPTLEWELIGE